jgi:hypothetical protein
MARVRGLVEGLLYSSEASCWSTKARNDATAAFGLAAARPAVPERIRQSRPVSARKSIGAAARCASALMMLMNSLALPGSVSQAIAP